MYNHFKLATKFLRYYFTAANGKGHGVHSPFVFDFIKNVLNNKSEYEVYKNIETIRKGLLKDKREIEIEDFGAGSGKLKANKRLVNAIAASSLKPRKFAQLLHRIVAYYEPANVVELGTSLGITSAYLAFAHDKVELATFEGSNRISEIANENFSKLGADNVTLYRGDFASTLPKFLQDCSTIDLAFIDGNHRLEPTVEYFRQLLSRINKNSILIFDDIHWSAQMEEAWKIIIEDPSVTLSIDLFLSVSFSFVPILK